MNLSPGDGEYEAQLPEQFGIPGAWSHGAVLVVPLLESDPLAAM
jgi:hypothetical protein